MVDQRRTCLVFKTGGPPLDLASHNQLVSERVASCITQRQQFVTAIANADDDDDFDEDDYDDDQPS